MDAELDLDAYLARVGVHGPLAADLDTVRRLHRAHVGAIPFENIDVQAGRGVCLDLQNLQDKLVRRRRGGYCFEQNTLFKAVLGAIGVAATPCEARVRPPGSSVLARTHMVLVVTLDGREWLCDVGFGGGGLFEPLPLDGQACFQIDREMRVFREPAPEPAHRSEGPLLVLQSRRRGAWEDAYAFVAERRYPIDFEVGNWYTSTHPASTFRHRLTAQITKPEARHVLRQLVYTVSRASGDEVRDVPRAELPTLLRTVFGLEIDDAVFPGLDGAGASPAATVG